MDAQTVRRLATNWRKTGFYPDKRFPPSPYYLFLGSLVQEMRPAVSVELGVCGGGACLYMARAFLDGAVVGVDHALEYPDQIAYIQNKFPNFCFCKGDSVEVASMVHAYWGKAKILFIDTIHTYERTMAEWNAWLPFLEEGAVVILDDLFRPGMSEVWNEMPEPKLRLDFLHIGGAPTDGGLGAVLL